MTSSLERRGPVFVLTMDNGENRIDSAWLDTLNTTLNEVDLAPGPKALVTTGVGRFYSNGLDLENVMKAGPETVAELVSGTERLFARLLTTPYVTVAACNGHTYAAGAMLALCHDFRLMRKDRGYFCLPEVDLGIPFTPGMDALIKSRLPQPVAHELMLTGSRYGGSEAAARSIVHEALTESEVVSGAVEVASKYAEKAGRTMYRIKSLMYGEVVSLLTSGQGTIATNAGD